MAQEAVCHGDRYPMGSQDLAARSLTLDQSDRHTECLGHKVENGVVCPALRCRCCDLDAKNVTVCSHELAAARSRHDEHTNFDVRSGGSDDAHERTVRPGHGTTISAPVKTN